MNTNCEFLQIFIPTPLSFLSNNLLFIFPIFCWRAFNLFIITQVWLRSLSFLTSELTLSTQSISIADSQTLYTTVLYFILSMQRILHSRVKLNRQHDHLLKLFQTILIFLFDINPLTIGSEEIGLLRSFKGRSIWALLTTNLLLIALCTL